MTGVVFGVVRLNGEPKSITNTAATIALPIMTGTIGLDARRSMRPVPVSLSCPCTAIGTSFAEQRTSQFSVPDIYLTTGVGTFGGRAPGSGTCAGSDTAVDPCGDLLAPKSNVPVAIVQSTTTVSTNVQPQRLIAVAEFAIEASNIFAGSCHSSPPSAPRVQESHRSLTTKHAPRGRHDQAPRWAIHGVLGSPRHSMRTQLEWLARRPVKTRRRPLSLQRAPEPLRD